MSILFTVFYCLSSALLISAGNKERNLWSSILTNNLDEVVKHLKDGAKPNHRNEVSFVAIKVKANLP